MTLDLRIAGSSPVMVVIESYFHGMPFCPFGIPVSDIFMTAHSTAVIKMINSWSLCGSCGLMDKASYFGSEDCRLEPCHGRDRSIFSWYAILPIWDTCF